MPPTSCSMWFARANLRETRPLLIVGGCDLNCDWNSKWKESGLFTEVFVPPVANDSGSAIGTAIDAQFHFTGNPKIDWNVYSGRYFVTEPFDLGPYDVYETNYELLADLLANNLILGWVSGKYEIGPRALGNRSILAAPFHNTRVRLNEIKQREQFRPIAPVWKKTLRNGSVAITRVRSCCTHIVQKRTRSLWLRMLMGLHAFRQFHLKATGVCTNYLSHLRYVRHTGFCAIPL